MVFVTHDQAEARTLSDRVALFNHGRIEQIASPKALYDAPCNPFVAGFIGDNNMLRGARDAAEGGLRTANGALLRARPAAGAARGADAVLCVRPESLQIVVGDTALLMQLHDVDNGSGRAPEWFAKVRQALPSGLGPGQRLSLGFRPDDAWLY
jgi:ABC-type Fe3+/spermidine/putrescine transport system ATPase subunit